MRISKFLAAIGLALSMASCGGGGGDPGISSGAANSVGSDIALFLSSPPSITIATGAASTYFIGGGKAPYTAVSSDQRVSTTTGSSGSVMQINGENAGNVMVLVKDALGAEQQVDVTVSSTRTTELKMTPSSATASVGDVLSFNISGGNPGYTVAVNNLNIASASSVTVADSGDDFQLTLIKAGTTTVAVTDAIGQTVTLSLTVNADPAFFRLSPEMLTVGENYVGSIGLSILGGNSNASYSVYTSDTVLSKVTVQSGKVIVGLGTQGNRCIDPVGTIGTTTNGGNVTASNTLNTYTVVVTVVDNFGVSATSSIEIVDNGGSACPSV